MNTKSLRKAIAMSLAAAAVIGSLSLVSPAEAALPVQQPSYQTVTETFDWGPAVSKIIVNVGRVQSAADVTKDTYRVHVRRELAEGAISIPDAIAEAKNGGVPLGSEAHSDKDLVGYREVTAAYVSDAAGNRVDSSEYVTIEMPVGPTDTLGAALNFDLHSRYNDWVKPHYTITDASGLVVTNNAGNIRPQADKFHYTNLKTDAQSNHESFPYASYEPADGGKHPLIIWLHGMGEGGNSPALPIMGNKATQFADESVQKYFGGAYVLAPQARTYWMHGYKDFGDGTSIYSDGLMAMIKKYIAQHPGVDASRIYVGGDSNGGYMTMLLVRDNPGFFAAAFPTCEGLKDKLISNKDLKNLAKTPLWFTAAKTDTVLPPADYCVPTVERLKKIGAQVHFSYFDNVVDETGLYKQADGTAYEYPGHWSWIYVYNDRCEDTIDGKTVKLFSWLAAQHR